MRAYCWFYKGLRLGKLAYFFYAKHIMNIYIYICWRCDLLWLIFERKKQKLKLNPRQGITWLMGRWRPQQTARRYVNCRTHDHWHVERILRLIHLVLFIMYTKIYNVGLYKVHMVECRNFIWLQLSVYKNIHIYIHNRVSSKPLSYRDDLWLKC